MSECDECDSTGVITDDYGPYEPKGAHVCPACAWANLEAELARVQAERDALLTSGKALANEWERERMRMYGERGVSAATGVYHACEIGLRALLRGDV